MTIKTPTLLCLATHEKMATTIFTPASGVVGVTSAEFQPVQTPKLRGREGMDLTSHYSQMPQILKER